MDVTLTKMLINSTDLEEYENYDIRLQRFPYPPYLEDKYLFALQVWLPLLIMLSFIYPALNITKSVVYEKEKKLKVFAALADVRLSNFFLKPFLIVGVDENDGTT